MNSDRPACGLRLGVYPTGSTNLVGIFQEVSDVVSTFILESQLVAVWGLDWRRVAAERLQWLLKWSRRLLLSLVPELWGWSRGDM